MTAIEYLEKKLKGDTIFNLDVVIAKAKELEKQQLGDCWDKAIKAHDDRGYVHAKSWCDFDDYYSDLKEKSTPQS